MNLTPLAANILDAVRKKRILGINRPTVLVSNKILRQMLADSDPAIILEIRESGKLFDCPLFVGKRANRIYDDGDFWEVI